MKVKTLIGTGYVVEDKIEDSNMIKVYPVSSIPTNGPEFLEELETVKTTTIDGEVINIAVNKTNTYECYWLNDGNSNSLLAPMICKGEIVELYKYAGQDIVYWKTIFTKPEYRKREKSLFFFSNKSVIDMTKSVLSKGYFMLVDSINKVSHFHTSDNDGELCTYDVSLNSRKGSLLVKDGRNNSIELVSHKDGLEVKTNQFVRVTTVEAEVNASKQATINTDYCLVKSNLMDINP